MNDPTAVVGRRIAAYLVDSLIVVAVFAIVFFALAEDNPFAFDADANERIAAAFGDPGDDSEFQAAWDWGEAVGGFVSVDTEELEFSVRIVEGVDFWVVNVVGFATSIGLLVVMQGLTGKTPGKAALGLATVRPDGSPPGIGKAVVRWLLLFVDAGLCFLPGLISSLASKGHRRIGDMAAGTYVVAGAAAGQPVTLDGPPTAYQAGPAPFPGGPSSYGVPPPPGAPPSAPPQPVAPAADAQWDQARQAWIRWDGSRWLQYDQGTGAWHPIS